MDSLNALLAVKAQLVCPPQGTAYRESFAAQVETELARLGRVISPPLRKAIGMVPQDGAVAWADWLLSVFITEVGGDRDWVPLYRNFPGSTPEDTQRLYKQRILALHFQSPQAPCLLCGATDAVEPVNPCGHLACRRCFNPAEYTACPICLRRCEIDPPLRLPSDASSAAEGPPVRLRRLDLTRDPMGAAVTLRDSLTTRTSPLSDSERADLELLIEVSTQPGDLTWAQAIPARQTQAIVTAHALRHAPAERRQECVEAVVKMWDTATDIARTLWVMSGGAPSLHVPRPDHPGSSINESWRPEEEAKQQVEIPRITTLPRPLRRAVMERLESLPKPETFEDILRHPTAWKRIAERLHPFEQAERYPNASLAFTLLRNSYHPKGSAAGRAVLAGERQGWIRALEDDRGYVSAKVTSFNSLVEQLLAKGDVAEAATILSGRPGEFLRRLDHLARTWAGDPSQLAQLAQTAATTAAPRVTFAAMASIRGRESHTPAHTASRPQRVFFPRGGTALAKASADTRAPIAPGVASLIHSSLNATLIRRASGLARYDVAVVDDGLRNVPLPSGTDSAAASSEVLPRGTLLPYPQKLDTLRLFLHWVEPDAFRVDLDLSAVFCDKNWSPMGAVDYTSLRSRLGAVHSGDLTSAPGPLGATEFLDLDVRRLIDHGVTWVVPLVFSYNDVPFQLLDAAIAGVGVPSIQKHFDPAGVLIRYVLEGDSRVSAPFVVNLAEGTLRWLDLHLPSRGYAHSLGTRGSAATQLLDNLEDLYQSSSRATMFDLAMVHARARAERVLRWDGTQLSRQHGQAVSSQCVDGLHVLAMSLEHPIPQLASARTCTAYSLRGGPQPGLLPLSDLLDQFQ